MTTLCVQKAEVEFSGRQIKEQMKGIVNITRPPINRRILENISPLKKLHF